MMSKLRVLIVDDHQMIRDGLQGLINAERDMEVIGEAGDGQEAFQRIGLLKPDVVIMDVSLPKLNGIKATEKIKHDYPSIKVIGLTAFEDEGYLSQMLKAGVSGYILKLAAAEELINAIRLVAAGETYFDTTISNKIINNYVLRKTAKSRRHPRTLTLREEEILRLVAQGYINKEIAAQLNISVKTVETHKSNFMEKLGLNSRADIVRYALNRGWL